MTVTREQALKWVNDIEEILTDFNSGCGDVDVLKYIRTVLSEPSVPVHMPPEMYLKLRKWANADDRKPANQSFTAGLERDIAYLIEDVSTVPQGWQLVPIEFTEDMFMDFMRDFSIYSVSMVDTFETAYKAMLSAAPKPEGDL